ncbi:MAG: sterol desaturase family protein [Betaproteobacteria bacterium]
MLTDIVFDMALFLDWRSALIGILVFSPLEKVLPLRKKASTFRRARLTDLGHFVLSGFVIRFGLLLAFVGLVPLVSAVVPSGLQAWVSDLPLLLQMILAALIADLGIYVAHRAMHEIPALWHFHAVHHSSEEMDWLAAFRVHPVDQLILKGMSMIPLFALNFSDSAILTVVSVYVWHALWVHSNVRLPLGPLRFVVVGPEFHHWHHANEREACDKNFSAQFPVWDIIFRTLHFPERMPDCFGVNDPVPKKWIGQIVYPFQRKDLKAASRSDKV